jgi:hypothetical protein
MYSLLSRKSLKRQRPNVAGDAKKLAQNRETARIQRNRHICAFTAFKVLTD